MQLQPVAQLLHKHAHSFHPVVMYTGAGKLLRMDLTENNTTLTKDIYGNTRLFSSYITNLLQKNNCRYGIGGYNELRTIYAASAHFDGAGEPRRLHLGIDIWGEAGTPVFAFMGGRVHSAAFNDSRGDYGATLVLQHQLEGVSFHTLYGHMSLADIEGLSPAHYVTRGQQIAHFGVPAENGQWPPHLHFQVIVDMQLKQGDYPGVCSYSEREKYLFNCPDPDLILQMNQFV